jgi:hypothetical protein
MIQRGVFPRRADFPHPPVTGGLFIFILIAAFLQWFSDLVKPGLEEIRISQSKRKTPSLVELRLDRCAAAHERNSYAHNLCVNSVLIDPDRNSRAHLNPGTVAP